MAQALRWTVRRTGDPRAESARLAEVGVAAVRRQAVVVLLGLVSASSAAAAGTSLRPPVRQPVEQLALRDWFGRPEVERGPLPWQREKNPTVAMVSSFLVPGLGQLYNEREFWSLVAAGVHFYFIGDIIVQARLANHYRTLMNVPVDPADEVAVAEQEEAEALFLLYRDNRIQSTWLLGLTLLLSGLQSFVDAHLFDFDADAPLQLEPSFGSVQGGALRLRF